MDLREQRHKINQETHWYYRSKSIPMIRYVKKILNIQPTPLVVVDIGAGTGYFSHVLDKKFGSKIAKIILVDINYSDIEVEQSEGKRIEKTKKIPEIIIGSLVLMMDLLEHIEHDDQFLKQLILKTQGKNYFFITVPSFMSLWSYHDVYLLHFRRYTLKSISELISNSGIKINARYYLYFALFPIAWFIRKVLRKNKKEGSDLNQPGNIINLILRYYFSLEMYFSKLNKAKGVTCCIEGTLNN